MNKVTAGYQGDQGDCKLPRFAMYTG